MSRLARAALAALLLAVVAGCGTTQVVHEPAVVVAGDQSARAVPDQPAPDSASIRIAVVTHGQASSPFWAIVRNGVEAAARQMDVLVTYLSLIHISEPTRH